MSLIGDGIEKKTSMTYETGTDVERACSFTFKDEHYVIGGMTQKNQISKITGRKLDRIGTLDFYLVLGTCTTVNNNLVYLCFCSFTSTFCGWDGTKECRFALRPEDFQKDGNYTTILSLSTHKQTSIAASNCKCIEMKYLQVEQSFAFK